MPNNLQASYGTKVLLDTNFLLLPFQRQIDIFNEIPRLIGGQVHFVLLPQIITELEWLKTQGTAKERRAAESAYQLMEQFCQVLTDLPASIQDLDADSALLRYAHETGAIVATNDGALRRKLVKQGSRAIFLRKLAILALNE
ncbi:MAG: PIN domain-containing protein [Promethearchaeota archaeon]